MSDRVLQAAIASPVLVERVLPAAVLVLLGVLLLFGAAFAQPDLLHNAAHDGRHAFAFPCH